jgi:hypothetical protein
VNLDNELLMKHKRLSGFDQLALIYTFVNGLRLRFRLNKPNIVLEADYVLCKFIDFSAPYIAC